MAKAETKQNHTRSEEHKPTTTREPENYGRLHDGLPVGAGRGPSGFSTVAGKAQELSPVELTKSSESKRSRLLGTTVQSEKTGHLGPGYERNISD